MKKILLMFTLGIIVLLSSGCSVGYDVLNYTEVEAKLENDETFVLVVGSASCSVCKDYKPTLDTVGKEYEVEIIYIDTEKISNEENDALYSKFIVSSTPTTIFIKDGEETSTYNRVVGLLSETQLTEKLRQLGYIE